MLNLPRGCKRIKRQNEVEYISLNVFQHGCTFSKPGLLCSLVIATWYYVALSFLLDRRCCPCLELGPRPMPLRLCCNCIFLFVEDLKPAIPRDKDRLPWPWDANHDVYVAQSNFPSMNDCPKPIKPFTWRFPCIIVYEMLDYCLQSYFILASWQLNSCAFLLYSFSMSCLVFRAH